MVKQFQARHGRKKADGCETKQTPENKETGPTWIHNLNQRHSQDEYRA
jgi:hypothetical protein